MSAPLTTACRAAVEGFTSNTDPSRKRDIYVDTIAVLLAFTFSLIILGFLGKWLWNSIIVELFSIAKPARSFWQIIGLMVFISLIRV